MAVAPAAAHDELHDDFATALRAQLARHSHLRDTTVVTHPGELPEVVQRYIAREGLDPTRVRGVHAEGRLYLVLANIPDLATGISVALHEAVGHLGLRAVLGDDLERVMLQLHETFPRDHDAWQHTADLYGYLDTGTDAGKIAFSEELCAQLAERDEPISEWEMVQAEIRQAIRADFPDLPMTDLDVRALVQRSRESLILRHGSPEEIDEVRERQQRRQRASGVVRESLARRGKGVPDALSLTLYRDGSRVLDGDGVPCRLYHGAGGDVDPVRRGFWGVVDPDLANDYAEMRAYRGAPATVIPFYANIQRPFDGDVLKNIRASWDTPDGLTVPVFIDEVIRQAGLDGKEADELRNLGLKIARCGLQEESGPTYVPQNFWYMTHWAFGRQGAEMLEEVFDRANFDGVRFTEQGSLSYGAFSASQVHFLDQGATPRGWQVDRHHGEGTVTERQPFRDWFGDSRGTYNPREPDIRLSVAPDGRSAVMVNPAFREWFGESQVVEKDGTPRVLYHGTRGAVDTLLPGKDGLGIHAGSQQAANEVFTSTGQGVQAGANIMPVHMMIRRPLQLPDLEYWQPREVAEAVMGANSRIVVKPRSFLGSAYYSIDDVVAGIKDAGFDGIVYVNRFEDPGSVSYIAFDPEQVRTVFHRDSLPGVPNPARALEQERFKRWFGNSRVVDRWGMPQVVYKGMHPYDWRTESEDNPRGEEITAIDRPGLFPAFFEDDPGVEIAGFFGDRDAANHFGMASTRNGAIYPVYLAIEEPYEVDAAGALAGELQFGATGQAFREAMRSDKYDGAILYNTGDEGTVYIAKRAEQIKSVFNAGSYDPANPDIRFSFAGEKAKHADRIQLHHARACLAAGMDEDLVRQETGWFRGVDGGWRFEIDDSEAELYPALRSLHHGARAAKHIVSFDHRRHDNGTYTVTLRPDDATTTTDFIELEQVSLEVLRSILPPRALHSVVTGEGIDEWGGLMPEAGLTVREPFEFYGFATLPLSHVLDHPGLFESYPNLKHIPVTVDPSKGMNASLVTQGNGRQYIELGRANQLSCLLHEVQHIIQGMERFARGGNIERMHYHAQSEAVAAYEAIDAECARVGQSIPEVLRTYEVLDSVQVNLMRDVGLSPFSRDDEAQLRHHLSPKQKEQLAFHREAYWAAVEEAGGFGDECISEFVGLVMERREARHASAISEFEARDLYTRLAGEVEARNVQARASLTAEQRRETDPVVTEDIHRGQQLILDAHDKVTAVKLPARVPSLSYADGVAGKVFNRTHAGEVLQSVASDLLGVLDAAGYDVGWMDGGCRILADALQGWSGGVIRLAVTGTNPTQASHMVGALPVLDGPDAVAVLLDADGVSSPTDMLQKLADVEGSPGERVLAIGVNVDNLSEGMLSDIDLSGRIRRMLEMRLGSFDSWRKGLHRELVDLEFPLRLQTVPGAVGEPKLGPRVQSAQPGA